MLVSVGARVCILVRGACARMGRPGAHRAALLREWPRYDPPGLMFGSALSTHTAAAAGSAARFAAQRSGGSRAALCGARGYDAEGSVPYGTAGRATSTIEYPILEYPMLEYASSPCPHLHRDWAGLAPCCPFCGAPAATSGAAAAHSAVK